MSEPQLPGESVIETRGKPLDRAAREALPEVVSHLRSMLVAKANWLSNTDHIADADLYAALEQLTGIHRGSLEIADSQAVISQALRENQVIEWVSYGMAIVLFLFGLVLLGVGVVNGDVATRMGAFLGGSIVELLILIPFRFAINSRRHNIALRMLGLILNRVDDPKKVASLLKDTFLAVVLGEAQFKGVK